MSKNVDLPITLKVDWLSFTISSEADENFEIMNFLGYDLNFFEEIPGKNFLNSGLSYGGGAVKVLFNRDSLPRQAGSSDIHDYIFSGVGCTDLAEKIDNGWVELFSALKTAGVKFKRIDLALDDFSNPPKVTFPMVVKKLETGEFVSTKRKWNHVLDREITGEVTGETVYLGARKSSSVGHSLLRIYDKQKQMISKGEESQLPIDVLKSGSWIRWEMELTKAKAIAAIDLIIGCGSVSEVAFGILRDLIDFKTPTKNSNGELYASKQRWTTVAWWDRFLKSTEKAKLIDPVKIYDLGSVLKWIRVAVVPTLQLVSSIFKKGLGVDFYEILKNLEPTSNLSKKQLRLLAESELMSADELRKYLKNFLGDEDEA